VATQIKLSVKMKIGPARANCLLQSSRSVLQSVFRDYELKLG